MTRVFGGRGRWAEMRGLAAPLRLLAARVRRRPSRWLLPILGIALPAALAGGIAATATITGDQTARSVLARLSPIERTVRVTAEGTGATSVPPRARRPLRGLDLGPPTAVVVLRPVRLAGTVVRPVAISPLGRWIPGAPADALSTCDPPRCPMEVAATARLPARLHTGGVRFPIRGRAPLRSTVPLGYEPGAGTGQPILVTGDVRGLAALPALGGTYRTGTWLAPLRIGGLHSWDLDRVESLLRRAQAAVSLTGTELSLTTPFGALEHARAQSRAAPSRLLLAGGAALAALVLFTLLAAGGLRADQRAELERLEAAGARRVQSLVFVAAEAASICGAGLAAGAGLAVATAVVLAGAAGEPAGAIIAHSLLTPAAALWLAVAWLATSAAMTLFVRARSGWIVDVLAFAALCTLATGLAIEPGGNDALALLVAPLACLAAGVVVFRGASLLLRGGERVTRRGPPVVRLALISLARAPAFPSLAIAFIAVSVGLGGFALAYRATLERGAADEAADQVPLDATVAPGADFATPVALAPRPRWRAIAGGPAFPVRRTDANFAGGRGTVTIAALGVPATALPEMNGWRAGDGSAPLAALARRLRPAGRLRVPGPKVAPPTPWLGVRVHSPALNLHVVADLRDRQGLTRRLPLGVTGPRASVLRARLPGGRWEVDALELDEPSGLEITNGHQNGENPAAATQAKARATFGPLLVPGAAAGSARRVGLGAWRAVGAAAARPNRGPGAVRIRFATSGQPGIIRPAQPSDSRAVPVLADPRTTAAAGQSGRLALTVDGQPLRARVVGVLRRFPTVPATGAGFVVADEATLASALDAQLPGQGRADELWISTADPARLAAALRHGPLSGPRIRVRSQIEDRLLAAPLARGVLGALLAAAAMGGALAIVGLLTALLGAARDERVERELEAQGVGPRGLRAELRARLLVASVLGAGTGLVLAVLLARLATAAVRAAGPVADPRPPLIAVVPWGDLLVWTGAMIAALAAAAWLATRSAIRDGGAKPRRHTAAEDAPDPRTAGAAP